MNKYVIYQPAGTVFCLKFIHILDVNEVLGELKLIPGVTILPVRPLVRLKYLKNKRIEIFQRYDKIFFNFTKSGYSTYIIKPHTKDIIDRLNQILQSHGFTIAEYSKLTGSYTVCTHVT